MDPKNFVLELPLCMGHSLLQILDSFILMHVPVKIIICTYTASQDVTDVFQSTSPAKEKWEKIGLSLGRSLEEIGQIRTTNGDRCDRCLYAVLNSWLVHNIVSDNPKSRNTWRKLLDVLKSPEVDEAALAETVMARKGIHCILYYGALLYTQF